MLAGATLTATAISRPQEASAAPQDITNLRMATWNLQGGTMMGESKWTDGVGPMLEGRSTDNILSHDIVALQEAGSAPPGDRQQTPVARLGNLQVFHYLWPYGRGIQHVYFMEEDVNGHRVNLAIATAREPQQVVIVPGGFSGSRSAFGVRFGTTWVFTVHGLSGSGNDMPGLIRNIATAAGGNSWMVLGDFNRDPNRMIRDMPRDANGSRLGIVASTGRATHRNGSELDYMVTSGDLVGILAPQVTANLAGSDHWPVEFVSALAVTASQFQVTATEAPLGTGATLQVTSPAETATVDDDLRGEQNWLFQNYNPADNTAQIANANPGLGCMVFGGSGAMKTAPCIKERDNVPPEQKMTIVDADVPGEGRDVQIKPQKDSSYCLSWEYTGQFTSSSGSWNRCVHPMRAAAETGGGNHWVIAPVRRVMIVGDSITQGHEGDFTWRYRLWQWLRNQKVAVDFVGPYSGTFTPDVAAPPRPPLLQGETPADQGLRIGGGYGPDRPNEIKFDSDHYAHWGRQAAQVKLGIRHEVETYRPDLILLAVGFNDMGWFVSDEYGTLNDVGQIVAQARDANPNVDFAVANVPQRTKIGGRDDLIQKTGHYNSLLPQAIADWQAGNAISDISLVDWAARYSCSPESCKSAYDGLHPNEYGEYQLAAAFAEVLQKDYGFGARGMGISNVPDRRVAGPYAVAAKSSPLGVTVTWGPVYGAVDYDVRSRIAGQTAWSEGKALSNRIDTTWTVDGITWEYQVRANYGCRPAWDPRDSTTDPPRTCTETKSEWSGTVSAVAHPKTAPPPQKIISRPTAEGDGVEVEITPPTGPYTDTIDRYELLLFDKDTPGAWLTGTGFRGNRVRVDGLNRGHHYIVGVVTWNAVGGGLPGVARPVTVGTTTPPAPTELRVTTVDPTTVQLDWNGSAAAAGYRLWTSRILEGGGTLPAADETIIDGTHYGVGFLFPGVWNYRFCVTAVNGAYESGMSNCVVPQRPAGSAPSAQPGTRPAASVGAVDTNPFARVVNPDGTRSPVAVGAGINGGDR
ncbi:GDSL-type esterase/lipase family protein [Amycolatopsis sp. NPDC051128]|uniref:GDSL-type esterase/lipase family protein n=1 Tax=Amycolatopsis sp. NPDC051128 TaxID=3155412 RepID=UPI0034468FDB